ncbi:hypothetical protein DH2020_035977 [Rehmannia glutinosa]|uniref:Tuftelin-interacting protein n=1 Tax=Rehmannia glutinosa TaxID=99300 RepID=A0ABR0V7P0_REHGL
MDEYQEMERFGMDNDYEDGQWIGGEFYGKRRQKRSKKRRKDLSKKIDYSKPVNFISTGSVMPSHEIERTSKEDSEVIDEDDLKPAGLGLGASAGLGFGSASSKNATREEKDEGDEFLPPAFGKKIMEGAQLRREREKEKSMQKKKSSEAGKRELDPTGVGSFEKHTKGSRSKPAPHPSQALEVRSKEKLWSKQEETVVALQKEKEKLQKEAHHRKQQLENMEEIQSVLDQIGKKSSSGTLTLESLAKSFVDLQTRFADDYKLCNLSCIACLYALPLFIRIFHGWDPLQNPTHGVEVVSLWKKFYKGMIHSISLVQPLHTCSCLWKLYSLPTSASARPTEHTRWCSYAKISAVVDSWDPRAETIPIHSWIRPWFPLLGQKLENCYHTIRHRLASVLHAWHPSDMSAYYILSPLKTVFDPASWEQLMVRYIIPKLLTVMDELPINPANQNLDQFYWVRTWVTAIPTHHMLQLMDVFFNKWQEVLYHWLCSKPNFEEVTKWYLGWKELLPPELQANEHIRYRLNIGLDMMNQAVEVMEVAPPGLKENISYLRVREQRQFETQKKAAAQAQRVSPGLDSGIQAEGNSGGLEMSLKEVIEIHAQHNGLLFKPKPGRTQDGHQIYGFGNISIIIDSLNQKVFAQTDDRWSLVSLEQPLELHNRSRKIRIDQHTGEKKTKEREKPMHVLKSSRATHVHLTSNYKKDGELSAAEISKLMTVIVNPHQFKIPDYFLNRQKAYVQDGKYSQVVTNALDMKLIDEQCFN